MAGRGAVTPATTRGIGLMVAAFISAGLIGTMLFIAALLSDERAEIEEVERMVDRMAVESSAATDAYFGGAEAAASMLHRAFDSETITRENLAKRLVELTLSHDSITGTFVGFPNGEFLHVQRSTDEPGRLIVKDIMLVEGERKVVVTTTDETLALFGVESLPNDAYDPRVRPWYVVFEDVELNEAWTDPYTFFSTGEAGITHSHAVRNPEEASDVDNLVAVIGVDVTLADLHDFLRSRRPTPNGSASVVAENGRLVAGTSMSAIAAELGSKAIAIRPVTTSAPWSLVVEAPHSDFLDTLRAQRRTYSIVALLAAAAGSLLSVAAALALVNHINRLRRRATTDELTGLNNRSAVLDHVRSTLAGLEDRTIGLMVIDLDDFKTLNDSAGHAVGDLALAEVGRRIGAACDDSSVFVGRLGGDEFVVVAEAPNGTVKDVLERIGTTIVDSISLSPLLPETRAISASAGYSTASQSQSPATAVELFANADSALYVAKSLPGPRLIEYRPSMRSPENTDVSERERLKAAIRNNRFVWHFQPERDLTSGAITGAEALIRWNHPTDGVIPAEVFIADLERFDLLPLLLRPMIAAAESLLHAIEPAEFTVRLNIAGDQIADRRLLALLEQAAVTHPWATFCLEVTERSIVWASQPTLDALRELRRIGVRVALDDFGTGYSSLRELQDLPVDAIKVDRAFVEALSDGDPHESIASIIIDLCDRLNLDVVAEGIETTQQLDALVRLGCPSGQGYLLGVPETGAHLLRRIEGSLV